MQWRMANDSDLVRRATRQAEEMIALLANHPSVFLYCYGSEPGEANFKKLGMALAAASRAADPTRIVQQANEYPGHWEIMAVRERYRLAGGYALLQRLVHRAPSGRRCTTSPHIRPNTSRSSPNTARRHSRRRRCCSDPAAGSSDMAADAARPPHPQTSLHAAGVAVPRRAGRDELAGFDRQEPGLSGDRAQVPHRAVPADEVPPCNGALMFTFNDCWPAVTWAVVDYARQPKQGYYALQQAFAPLHVMLIWNAPLAATPGAAWQAEIIVVNDLPRVVRRSHRRLARPARQTGAMLAEGDPALRCARGLPGDASRRAPLPPPGGRARPAPAPSPSASPTRDGDIRATNAYTLTLRSASGSIPWQNRPPPCPRKTDGRTNRSAESAESAEDAEKYKRKRRVRLVFRIDTQSDPRSYFLVRLLSLSFSASSASSVPLVRFDCFEEW